MGDVIQPRSKFQSTPPAEARGDSGSSRSASFGESFNPLPPPKRGETSDSHLLACQCCFNPLPPPKRGETGLIHIARCKYKVSIHSPAEARGDMDTRT